jgi:hypothetical protein
MALLKYPCDLYALPRFPYVATSPAGRPPLQSPGAACGTRWPSQSPPASNTHCRGCSTPPSPARFPTSFAIARHCVWYSIALLKFPAIHTRCRGSRTPRPPPPVRPPPWPLSGAPCGARAPRKSSQDSDALCRGCCRQTKQCSASKSARRLPPPWPRAPAQPRPASRQHRQAALASSTRASAVGFGRVHMLLPSSPHVRRHPASCSSTACTTCDRSSPTCFAAASCASIFNTRIWSAAGFAAVVPARAAAAHLPLCPAFHALICRR